MNKRLANAVSANDPTTWPDPNNNFRVLSQTLPNLQYAAIVHSNGKKPQKDTSEAVVEQLVEYCRVLQSRNSLLESEVQKAKLNMVKRGLNREANIKKMLALAVSSQSSTAGDVTGGQTRLGGSSQVTGTADEDKAGTNEYQDEIFESMGDIDLKVLHLRELFRKGDAMQERHRAATKIAARIRGFCARRRLKHYRVGLKTFRWARCKYVVWILDMLLQTQNHHDAALRKFKLRNDVRTLRVVYVKWLFVVRQVAPLRRAVRKAAEDKFFLKMKQLLRQAFVEFRDVCVGKLSVRNANKERRLLIEKIRADLSEKLKQKGEIGVVEEGEVIIALHRRVVTNFLESKKMLMMKGCFGGFKEHMRMCRSNERAATEHWFRTRAGKCFYSWSDHVYMVSQGLDRKRWKGPRKYEIRYNQKRIDTFARHRILKFVLKPWMLFNKMRCRVKQLKQRQLGMFIRRTFICFREVTREQHRLREMTLTNWRAYARIMTEKPFEAWASYARAAKNNNNEQSRIVNKYIRWKTKHKMLLIIRTWRHQALYGRIDGMYTRKMLVQSLGEQKQLSTTLERMMAAQAVELEECMELVEREIQKRRDLEKKLVEAGGEIGKHKMISHHIDQELRRVEAIVESMMLINPRQIAHLQALQPDFTFKFRKVHVPSDDHGLLGKNDEAAESTGEQKVHVDVGQFSLDGMSAEADNASIGMEGTETAAPAKVDEAPAAEQAAAEVKPAGVAATSASPHSASDGAPGGQTMRGSAVQGVSACDQLLLDRAKWLVSYLGGQDIDAAAAAEGAPSPAPPSPSRTRADSPPAQQGTPTYSFDTPPAPPPSPGDQTALMLLNIVDFLRTGDVSRMAEDDRRQWTKAILQTARVERAGAEEEEGDDEMYQVESAGLRDVTWRNTLLGLRSMFPGAGNYSGVGSGLDGGALGIYSRIRGMREHVADIVKNQERKNKFRQSLLYSNLDGEPESPNFNLYASNVDKVLMEERKQMNFDVKELRDIDFEDAKVEI